MATWHEILSYVYDGERATGIGEFVSPESPLGTANRTAAELLENDEYLLDNFTNYAALSGAVFSGNVSVLEEPVEDSHVATKQYADTKAVPLRYNFYTSQDTWLVTHNLGRDVSVSVYNEQKSQIYAAVEVFDDNSFQIKFKIPLRGYVYVV